MKRYGIGIVTLALMARMVSPIGAAEPQEREGGRHYWPTKQWRVADPATQGVDPNKLADAWRFASGQNTKALLIVRHGYIVAEYYAGDFYADDAHDSYSMAKSVCSAVVGIAIQQKKIESVQQKLTEFFPMRGAPADAPYRGHITIEHLLTMTSGTDFDNKVHYPQMKASPDWVDYVLSRPVTHAPGSFWRYTADPTLLSGIVSKATGMSMYAYAKSELFDPIGMNSVRWKGGPNDHTNGNGDLFATARDCARFGFLYLNNGRWDGRQILPADWVERSTQPCRSAERAPCDCWQPEGRPAASGAPFDYGYLWWCRRLPGVPADAYYAFGGFGQFILIVPSLDVVMVRLGHDRVQSDLVILPEMAARIVAAVKP